MVVDLFDRGGDVAAPDRLEQRAVLPVVFVDLFRRQDLDLHRVPLVVAAHRVDLLIQVQQQRIPGTPGEPIVEHAVVAGKGVLVVPAPFEIVQNRFQHLDLGGRGMKHRQAGHVRLDGQARLDQFQRADPADDVVRRVDRKVVVFDKRAAADPALDQAFAFQIEQDLADGAARGVEALRQLPLGRQLIAVDVASAANRFAQPGRNLPDMAPALAEARARSRPGLPCIRARGIHSGTLRKSTRPAVLTQLVDIGKIGLQLVLQRCKVATVQSHWIAGCKPVAQPN